MALASSHGAGRFVPLSPAGFHILLALVDGPQHGYAIMRAVRDATNDALHPGPATVYRLIAEFSSARLIKEFVPAKPAYDDARRKYYQLTTLGREVVAEEARRMAAAVNLARAKKLITTRVP
jgi:DNA-binding PadR family transcriptional regulator